MAYDSKVFAYFTPEDVNPVLFTIFALGNDISEGVGVVSVKSAGPLEIPPLIAIPGIDPFGNTTFVLFTVNDGPLNDTSPPTVREFFKFVLPLTSKT